MTNEKLAQHLSNHLWISKDRIVEVLGSYNEEEHHIKHPIELVNEKYPNGWCTDSFKQVIKELNNFYIRDYNGHSFFYGVFKKNCFSDNNKWGTYINKEEYLSITRPLQIQPTKRNLDIEPNQRNWTGVIYKNKSTGEIRKIDKGSYSDDYPYSILNNSVHYKQIEVDRLFLEGSWIELIPKQETPIIHAEKPNTLEERVKIIEQHLKL